MLTVLAGPVFNFLLTIVVFAGHRHLAGRADRAADDRRDRGAARGRAAAAAGGRAARRRTGGRWRASRTSTRAAQAMPAPAPMPVRVERDGEAVDLDGALRAAAAGAGRRAAVAGEPGRAQARRRDPGGRRPAARLVRASCARWCSAPAAGRSRSRSGATATALTLDITPMERDTDDGEGGFERRVMIGVAGAPLYLPATETPAPWTALGLRRRADGGDHRAVAERHPLHRHRRDRRGEPAGAARHRPDLRARRRRRGC